MRDQNQPQKGTALLTSLRDKASVLGKKVTDGVQTVTDNVQQGVQTMSEKAKADSYERRLNKYNPLFAKEYRSKSFHRSDVIVIGNDKDRRNVDVCEGAIGWQEYANDSVILCLYSDWIKKSGLTFVPEANEGSVYCVDRFDPNRYIDARDIFERTHSEKLAELENIAYCLGAKRCEIEIVDNISESSTSINSATAKIQLFKASGSHNANSKSVEQHSGKKITVFQGNNHPIRPELKWFADDTNINALIQMRCSDTNSVKSRALTLEGSTLYTMGEKTAASLDTAFNKNKIALSTSMEYRMQRERSSKLVFNIEF